MRGCAIADAVRAQDADALMGPRDTWPSFASAHREDEPGRQDPQMGSAHSGASRIDGQATTCVDRANVKAAPRPSRPKIAPSVASADVVLCGMTWKQSTEVQWYCRNRVGRSMTEHAHPATNMLVETLVNLMRSSEADLSVRELAVLLACYLEPGPHTVRAIAARLAIPKSAVTRAMDRLVAADFIRRAKDSADRRSIIVAGTEEGAAFVGRLREHPEGVEARLRLQ